MSSSVLEGGRGASFRKGRLSKGFECPGAGDLGFMKPWGWLAFWLVWGCDPWVVNACGCLGL